MVAGARTHHSLRSADGRFVGPADVGEVAKHVKMVAGGRKYLNLLFHAVEERRVIQRL